MIKNRRGLSTLVGAVFFIIAASSTVAYVSYSMNTIDSFSQAIIIKESTDDAKSSEIFEITDAKITNGKFDLTVNNQGTLPIKVTNLWIENKTDSTWTPRKYSINSSISPSGSISSIGQSLNLYALSTQSYKITLVTERGNSETYSFNSVNQQPISLQLHTAPDSVSSGFSTTVFMTVTNNLASGESLLNVTPNTLVKSGSASTTCDSSPTPTSQSILKKGETVIFRWSCTVSGNAGQQTTFTASLVNGYAGNQASTTVTLKDVLFAFQSGTSLESLGFTVPSSSNDILTLHQETSITPNGEYQLSSGTADQTGSTVDLDQNNLKFITKNSTTPITVPAGTWNATLNYLSDRLPSSVSSAILSNGFIFHFEKNTDPVPNGVSGATCDNEVSADIPSGTPAPTWSTNGGVYSSGGYTFDGIDDYISVNVDTNCNDIAAAPNTTAGWFYPDSTGTTSRQVILRTEASNGNEFYEVVFDNTGDSKILKFRFQPLSGQTVQCASSALAYDTWHHFVAVRSSKETCSLYVDGALAQTFTLSGSVNPQVDINGVLEIGANPSTNGARSEYFKGKIDSLMHWETVALSLSEAQALYNTKYGVGATVVNYTIEKVNSSGLKTTLISQPNYNLKFLDPLQNSANFILTYNVTSTLPQVDLNNERLLFTINFVSGLGSNVRIDDSTLSNPKSSQVQIPYPSAGFPGYFSYTVGSGNYQVSVSNTGSIGAFLPISGIRGVFDDTSGDLAYGSIPKYVNGTTTEFEMKADQDSVYLPPGKKITITFYAPTTHPSVNGQYGAPIQGGKPYNYYIFLSGYDEIGKTFFKTIDVGGATVQ